MLPVATSSNWNLVNSRHGILEEQIKDTDEAWDFYLSVCSRKWYAANKHDKQTNIKKKSVRFSEFRDGITYTNEGFIYCSYKDSLVQEYQSHFS